MKLYHSALSPFVRKVTIAASFLGIAERIELIAARGSVMLHDPDFRRLAPSGQIPVLVTESGTALFDSTVICDYLNELADGDLFGRGEQRLHNLRDQALGDTMCDAALLVRYETGLRPAQLQWQDWHEAWASKITDTLAWLEARPGHLQGRCDIGAISVFCALAFIDNRVTEIGWRSRYPGTAAWFDAFASRPEVASTDPY